MKKKETITQKIRDFISGRPDVTLAEIEEMLGFTSRSIKTIAGYEYKKAFGHTFRKVTNTELVTQYFKENPDATVKEAANALSLSKHQVYQIIFRKNIEYRHVQRQDLVNGSTAKIHAYAMEHPFALPTECESVLDIKKATAKRILCKMREKGIIPRKTKCVSRVLTPFDVKAINELFSAGYTNIEIAKMFNVSYATIKRYRELYVPANDEFEDMGVTGI